MNSSSLKVKPLTLSVYILPHMDKKGFDLKKIIFLIFIHKQSNSMMPFLFIIAGKSLLVNIDNLRRVKFVMKEGKIIFR